MSDPAVHAAWFGSPTYRAGVIELLGALAYTELTAFERLAEDATLTDDIADKSALAAMAVAEFHHYERLAARLGELGADPADGMAPFRGAVDEFHRHTRPRDQLESLVKVFVGDSIATDFYREIATYLDDDTRDLVLTALQGSGHAAFAVEKVREAIAADGRVAGRLALWGRRLVGEALAQAQRVVVERDALAAVLVGDVDHPGMDLADLGRMFARLTEQHSQRMAALGLQA